MQLTEEQVKALIKAKEIRAADFPIRMQTDPAFASLIRGEPHPDITTHYIKLVKPIKGEDQ